MPAVTITTEEIQAIVAKLRQPPVRGVVNDIFHDIESAASWVEQLAGDFCNDYKTGFNVGGQTISIYDLLKHAADIANATGTADGKAVGAAITVVIAGLNGFCGNPANAT